MNWDAPIINDVLQKLESLESFMDEKEATQADIGNLDDATATRLYVIAQKCNDVRDLINRWIIAKGQMVQSLAKLKGEQIPVVPNDEESPLLEGEALRNPKMNYVGE